MSKYPLYSTLILLMPEIAVFFFAFCAYILGKFTHLNQKAPFHCFSLFFSIIGLFLSLLPLFFYHHILSLEPDLNLYTPAVHLNLEIICVKILIIILAIISLFFFKNAIAKSYKKYAAKREVYRPRKTPYNPNFSSILSVLERFKKIPLSEELVTKHNAIEEVDFKNLDLATQESMREINSELEKEGYTPIEKMFVPMWKLKKIKKQDSAAEVYDDDYYCSIPLSQYQVPEYKNQDSTAEVYDDDFCIPKSCNFQLPDFKEFE